jgi:hypothetical protein
MPRGWALTTKVTEEEKAKIDRAVMEMVQADLEYAERNLKLPVDPDCSPPDRLGRIREAIIDMFEDNPEQQDKYKRLNTEQLFDALHAYHKTDKRMQN